MFTSKYGTSPTYFIGHHYTSYQCRMLQVHSNLILAPPLNVRPRLPAESRSCTPGPAPSLFDYDLDFPHPIGAPPKDKGRTVHLEPSEVTSLAHLPLPAPNLPLSFPLRPSFRAVWSRDSATYSTLTQPHPLSFTILGRPFRTVWNGYIVLKKKTPSLTPTRMVSLFVWQQGQWANAPARDVPPRISPYPSPPRLSSYPPVLLLASLSLLCRSRR